VHVDIVGPAGLADPELADAADLLARLVAGGAALGWVEPPPPAEVTALLRAIWTAPPGDAALAVATADAFLAVPAEDSVLAVATEGSVLAVAAEDAALAATDGAVLGVAADGGRVADRGSRRRLVGLAYWRRYERPTHRPHADVEKVAVATEVQGRGIGRRLMTALIAAARDTEIEILTLDLRGDNEQAVALYESLGFQRYGRLPRFVAVGDRRWDKLFYALNLRAG
jgi:ribosomal protein S18 acetylase RimI-like enzyme